MTCPNIDYKVCESSRRGKRGGLGFTRITINGVEKTLNQWRYWFKTNQDKYYSINRMYRNAIKGRPIECTTFDVWVEPVEGSPIESGWNLSSVIAKTVGCTTETIYRNTKDGVYTWKPLNRAQQKSGRDGGAARQKQIKSRPCDPMEKFCPEMHQFTSSRVVGL